MNFSSNVILLPNLSTSYPTPRKTCPIPNFCVCSSWREGIQSQHTIALFMLTWRHKYYKLYFMLSFISCILIEIQNSSISLLFNNSYHVTNGCLGKHPSTVNYFASPSLVAVVVLIVWHDQLLKSWWLGYPCAVRFCVMDEGWSWQARDQSPISAVTTPRIPLSRPVLFSDLVVRSIHHCHIRTTSILGGYIWDGTRDAVDSATSLRVASITFRNHRSNISFPVLKTRSRSFVNLKIAGNEVSARLWLVVRCGGYEHFRWRWQSMNELDMSLKSCLYYKLRSGSPTSLCLWSWKCLVYIKEGLSSTSQRLA